jgi:hypothetical protein
MGNIDQVDSVFTSKVLPAFTSSTAKRFRPAADA